MLEDWLQKDDEVLMDKVKSIIIILYYLFKFAFLVIAEIKKYHSTKNDTLDNKK